MSLLAQKFYRPNKDALLSTVINNLNISIFTLLLCHYTLIQIQFGFANGYDGACFNSLESCKKNEVCSLSNNNKGICTCMAGFIKFHSNKTCISYNPEPPPEPHSSNIALSVGLTFLVLGLVALVGILHYKFRIFSGIIHSFYRFRRRPSSGQAYQITDEGDDVHPIV